MAHKNVGKSIISIRKITNLDLSTSKGMSVAKIKTQDDDSICLYDRHGCI